MRFAILKSIDGRSTNGFGGLIMGYNPSLNWLEQVKGIVTQMMEHKQFVLDGTISSIDPTYPYKVRVNLEPYEIETGWLRMATPYVGDKFGLILPPPDEGTHVKVIFSMGDIEDGTVVSCDTNDDAIPPDNIDSQTLGLFHKSGSYLKISSDGTVQIKGKNSSQSW